MRFIFTLLFFGFILSAGPVWADKFPTCCKICKEGQACGNSCISKKEACPVPLDWGCACDYRYIVTTRADRAKCCLGHDGVGGCAGDRILCNDGTFSAVCGCMFEMHQAKESYLGTGEISY